MDQLMIVVMAILVVAVAAIAFMMGRRNAKSSKRDEAKATRDTVDSSGATVQTLAEQQVGTLEPKEPVLPVIRFEEARALASYEESALVEVKDPRLISCVDAAVPVVVRGVADAASICNVSTAINAANAAAEAAGPVYRAIIPKGAELAKSRSMEDAVRGFYHGTDGISGHANLIQVDPTKLDQSMVDAMKAASAVNAAMSVGAMVVGQYYMTQISAELKRVTKGIDAIAEFQNDEYYSKVQTLVALIQRSTTHQMEVMESEALRKSELASLKDRESECIQLLGQANKRLASYADRYDRGMSFEDYEREVLEADKWLMYQQTLCHVLVEISRLSYTLSMGAVSLEYSTSVCRDYLKQANDALLTLSRWNGYMATIHELNADRTKRRRRGVGKVLMGVPGVFDDDLNFVDISPKTSEAIKRQMRAEVPLAALEGPDLYQQDVRLVLKGGKVFYLPSASA